MRIEASTVKIAYNIARNCGLRGKLMTADRAEIRGAAHSSSHTGMRHAPATTAKRTNVFILTGTRKFDFQEQEVVVKQRDVHRARRKEVASRPPALSRTCGPNR